MSYSVNKAIVVGNLGRDPEYKVIPSGVPVCSFSVATTERVKNQNGEFEDRTEWHNIECWRGLADVCNKYLHKGSKVYIEGKIRTHSYDKNGVTMYMTRIVADDMVMLSSKGESGGSDFTAQSRPYAQQKQRPQANPYAKQMPQQQETPAQQGGYNVDMETETFDDVPF